ncbi:MAG: glycoside hydrolase family 92 protein [Verrucomicrobia bacterium]|nr:glycoside hydrolase family 92 protein [Verrucomicrobiota bacterium]
MKPPRFRWRRWWKMGACGALVLAAVVSALAGSLLYRYARIVGAQPGGLASSVEPGPLGRWVNPFIGTGGFPWVCGNNFPGAMVPFGMVRLSPETRSLVLGKRALNTSGYFYGDPHILGFSHTRLNGTGATDGGHILVRPSLTPIDQAGLRRGLSWRFSHREETAFPGYYAVRLPQPDVLVELTATARVGVHRYTFPPGQPPHLHLDVSNALGGRPSRSGTVRVLPSANEVEGSIQTFGTFAARYGGIRVYFVARSSQPFASATPWRGPNLLGGQTLAEGDRVGVDLGFPRQATPSVLTLKLALSYVSLENARANLDTEVGAATFDDIAARARQAWEQRLFLVKLEGGTDQQRTLFYTALYRVFQMPTVFSDANGQYLGFDRRTHQATDFRYFTDLSLWDTFRTTHPLYTLIAPGDQRDMLVSLVKMLEQGGWLPRWPAGHGYSNSMLGTPADIVIAESFLKGIRDFDVEQAYQAMKRTALAPTPPGAPFSGRQGIEHYLEYGYCPRGLVRQSVARTFEFAWADRALGLLAEARGQAEDAARFRSDLHAAYLFNGAGRPDLTQKWVRWILEHKYANRYDGLEGNDDGGTLSAWYVLSALGLYPVAGSDLYQLGAPLFEQ